MREFVLERRMPRIVVDMAQRGVRMTAPCEGLWYWEVQAGALHGRGREGNL